MSSSSSDDNDLGYYTNAGKNMSDFRTGKLKMHFDKKVIAPISSTSMIDSSLGLSLSPPKQSKIEPTATPTIDLGPLDSVVLSDVEDEPSVPVARRRGRPKRAQPARKVAAARSNTRGRRGRNSQQSATKDKFLDDCLASSDNHVGVTISKYSDPSTWTLDDSLPVDKENESFTVSEDDLNELFTVKVCWKSGYVFKFPIRKYQNMLSVFEHFSTKENVPFSQILLSIYDKTVLVEDTPDSLKLTVASIIEGGITSIDVGSTTTETSAPIDKDSLELKVRRKDTKIPTMIRILKTQKMSVLMMKYSELTDIPREKLKFSFDGDSLDPDDTPVDLDLEGGEMIDLVVV